MHDDEVKKAAAAAANSYRVVDDSRDFYRYGSIEFAESASLPSEF